MNSPLVSILSPCYNVADFLPQCLDSIISQTYTNLQIVLIDDGSRDDTWGILQDYANRDSRIEIYHQENQGVASTRNNLLEKVKGDYVLFVDSDDWIELDMVEAMLQLAVENDADIVNCNMVKNDGVCMKDQEEIVTWSQEEAICHFLKHRIFNGSLWNKLVASSLLHNVRFHCGISYGEDALVIWNVLQKVKKVVRTTSQYYHYRMNDDSLSHRRYDAKHISGHLVWKQISEETTALWPQYSNIASANYAISDMWQLYYALLSNYPKDTSICGFQKHVRKSLFLIYNSRLIDSKKMLFAVIVSFSYRLGGVLLR